MERKITYEELKGLIARAYPNMSKQLQRIARYALEHPNDLALGTVAALAQANEVQPSAMIRFAAHLGYGGFSEMQQVFRGHLLERSESYRERISHLRHKKTDGLSGTAGILHQLAVDSVEDLGHLEENIRTTDLVAATRLIATAPRIHVLGQRRAFPIAAYLGYALSMLELRTHLLAGTGGMLAQSLRSIAPEDVLIAASFQSYSREVIDAAAMAKDLGTSTIAITDGPLSPLKATARICFEIASDSSREFRSLAAPLCLAQALVVGAGLYLIEHKKTKSSVARPRQKRT
jgi:DNA-binding MurR/RpiR family transcriptional regulator